MRMLPKNNNNRSCRFRKFRVSLQNVLQNVCFQRAVLCSDPPLRVRVKRSQPHPGLGPAHRGPTPAWAPPHRGPAPGNPATFTRLSLSFIIRKCGAKAHRRTRRAPACRGQAAEPKTRGWGHRSGSDRRTLPGKSPGNSAPHRHPDFRFLPQNWEGVRGPLFPVPQETHTPHISGHLGGRDRGP